MPLTPLQEKFCQNVAAGLTAAEAARSAGYGPRYALAKAARLARQPQISERIAELRGPVVPPPQNPVLAQMSLPMIRTMVAGEAHAIAVEARAANDRRGAVAALGLLADVLGLKTQGLRIEASPLDSLTAPQLVELLTAIDAQLDATRDADGATSGKLLEHEAEETW